MTPINETNHMGEFLVSEANGRRSREAGVLATGNNLAAGAILDISLSGASGAAAADAGNTGDGTVGAITVGADAMRGNYRLVFIDPAANAGDFAVEDPAGRNVGNGTVGSAFSGGGLSFTVSDGAVDFAVGDAFTITVSGGNEQYTEHDPATTDRVGGVLYDAVDASAADQPCVVIARDAEVNSDLLDWPTGITAAEQELATAELEVRGIIIR